MNLFARWLKGIEESSKNERSIIPGIAGMVILLIIWELCVRIYLLSTGNMQFAGFLPERAFFALMKMFIQPFFWRSVLASLFRIGAGLILAGFIGVPAGLIVGSFPMLKRITNPPIQFIRMISPISWMPLALVFLPGFEEAIIFLITMATLWPILLNTRNGVGAVNNQWIEMARNQGASPKNLILKVIYPAALPHIISGLRLAVGIGWVVLVPAELLGISSGLGYLINDARDTLEYDRLMAVITMIGIIGFTIDSLFQVLINRYDWRDS